MELEHERRTNFRHMMAAIVAMLLVQSPINSPAYSEVPAQSVMSHGLTVYFGVLPAPIAKGITGGPMHDGRPSAAHSHHLIVAIFNSVTGERVTDAGVAAKVTQPGFEPPEKPLEPMKIADTITYGNFFDLSKPGIYRIRLRISRPGGARPIMVDLLYDHPIPRHRP
jgi:hypothetical protein